MLAQRFSNHAAYKRSDWLFLSSLFFMNLPHFIPAFVLTQILQSRLAQIKPHPF